MNTAISPAVGGIVIQSNRAIQSLAPLAGMTGQDITPYTSAWVRVHPGGYLAAKLTITKKVGSFFAYVETCHKVDFSGPIPVAVDAPRLIGGFPQIAGPITSPSVQPFRGLALADEWIRVVATPGQGLGQTCDWTVSGEIIAAAYTRRA
jgi:hypothetical protein